MRRRLLVVSAIAAVVGLAVGAVAGAGPLSKSSPSVLPSSSCGPVVYKGSGSPDYIIASDLPLQGSGRTQTVQMTEAIKFILKQHDFKAGDTTIGYQSCDDSTAQQGKWASEKC